MFMLFDQRDDEDDWILQRYLEGMRAPAPVQTGQPRSSRAKKTGEGDAGGLGGSGGGDGGGSGVGGGRGVSRGSGSAAAVGGTGGSAGAANRVSGDGRHRRALCYPSPSPTFPPESTSLLIRGRKDGTCTAHLEFDMHHSNALPNDHVAVFLVSHEPNTSNARYLLDLHPSFCVERSYPLESLLSAFHHQRLVWPVADLEYVFLLLFTLLFASARVKEQV